MLAPFPSRRYPVSETNHGIVTVAPGLKVRVGFWDPFKSDNESNESETRAMLNGLMLVFRGLYSG